MKYKADERAKLNADVGAGDIFTLDEILMEVKFRKGKPAQSASTDIFNNIPDKPVKREAFTPPRPVVSEPHPVVPERNPEIFTAPPPKEQPVVNAIKQESFTQEFNINIQPNSNTVKPMGGNAPLSQPQPQPEDLNAMTLANSNNKKRETVISDNPLEQRTQSRKIIKNIGVGDFDKTQVMGVFDAGSMPTATVVPERKPRPARPVRQKPTQNPPGESPNREFVPGQKPAQNTEFNPGLKFEQDFVPVSKPRLEPKPDFIPASKLRPEPEPEFVPPQIQKPKPEPVIEPETEPEMTPMLRLVPEPEEVHKSNSEQKQNQGSNKKKKKIIPKQEPDYFPKPEPLEDDIADYADGSQAEDVERIISGRVSRDYIRLAVITLIMAGLAVLTFFDPIGMYERAATATEWTAKRFVLLNMSGVIIAFIACFCELKSGLARIFKAQVSIDVVLITSTMLCLFQHGWLFFEPEAVRQGGLHPASLICVFGMFLIVFANLTAQRRTLKNFCFLARVKGGKSAQLINDEELTKKINRTPTAGQPNICCEKPAEFMTDFLSLSYGKTPDHNLNKYMSTVLAVVALCFSVVFAFLPDVRPIEAFSVFVTLFVLATPAAAYFNIQLSASSAAKKARRKGAMISGFRSALMCGGAQAIALNAEELFPSQHVTLSGMKLLGDTPVDKVVLYTAAAVVESGGPMTKMFLDIIEDRGEILPRVCDLSYRYKRGLSARVNGESVLIGNKKLLMSCGITPPAVNYEVRYAKDGVELFYVAIDGELCALFLVTFEFERDVTLILRKLERSNMRLIINTVDANITKAMLAKGFLIEEDSIVMMPEQAIFEYNRQTGSCKKAKATIVNTGGVSGFVCAVMACKRLRGSIKTINILQIMSAVLGYGAAAVAFAYSGAAAITPVVALLYLLIWMIIEMILPMMRQ